MFTTIQITTNDTTGHTTQWGKLVEGPLNQFTVSSRDGAGTKYPSVKAAREAFSRAKQDVSFTRVLGGKLEGTILSWF